MEYDRWQVCYHGAAARLNFPFGTRLVHLVPPKPRVVTSPMAREDREAWERLEGEAADEAYMQELHRQHLELAEAERIIFAGADGGEVILLSYDDEVKGGEDSDAEGVEVGGKDEEIDMDEWRSVFPKRP